MPPAYMKGLMPDAPKGLALGRVVRYVIEPGNERAAVIAYVHAPVDGTVNLAVFRAHDLDPGAEDSASWRQPSVKYDESGAKNTWHFPSFTP